MTDFNPYKLLHELMGEWRYRLHAIPDGFALEVSPAIPSDLVERVQRSWKEGCDKSLRVITGIEVIGVNVPPMPANAIPYNWPVW